MTLAEWREGRLPALRAAGAFSASKHADAVTLVAYSFPADPEGGAFDEIEFAVRQSWSALGMMKTALVVNAPFAKAAAFAAEFPEWIELQIEPSLVPGDIATMSADCASRLHARFATPYCLVVQGDGFPLRGGLGAFLGKWDFVGAPYVRVGRLRNAVCRVLGAWVSNGGFSLRSKAICEAAARFWERKYAAIHPCEATVDDLYYTRTLPLRHPSYRLRFRIADNLAALRFSYDALVPQPVAAPPLGFHRASTFAALWEKGLLEGDGLPRAEARGTEQAAGSRLSRPLVGRVALNAPSGGSTMVGRVAPNAPLVGRVALNAPSSKGGRR